MTTMTETLTYSQVGDYLLPNLTLSETPEEQTTLGRYGLMRKAFLKEHRTINYNPLQLLSDMRDTMIAPRNVPTAEFASKPFKYFITQDEIDSLLLRGGNYSEGKYRILSFFLSNADDKERIALLKEAYGQGGGSWSDTDGWQDAALSKGLSLSRGRIGSPDAEVNLGWNAVARRIDTLIKTGQYMSKSELDGIASYEKIVLARSINAFYYDLPDEYPRPFARGLDFHYPHENEWNTLNDFLSNGERVSATVDQMRYIFENMPDNDRYYSSRKAGLERLAAFQEGVYTLFPGVENLPERYRPIHGRQRIAPDIKRKQPPKLKRRFAVEITAQLPGRKVRTALRTPNNAVEFFPRVAEVVSVPVDYRNGFRVGNQHVANVVIAVLIALRAIFEQMTTRVKVGYNSVVAVKAQAALAVFVNLAIGLAVESNSPFLLRVRRGNRVNLSQNFARAIAENVLVGFVVHGQNFRRVRAVNPRQQLVAGRAAAAHAEVNGARRGNVQLRNALQHLKLGAFALLLRNSATRNNSRRPPAVLT
jgi:hypothetical protein